MRLSIITILFIFYSCGNPESDISTIEQHQSSPMPIITYSGIIIGYVYSENGKSGLMDTSKNVILPTQFDYIDHWPMENLIRIDSGGHIIDNGDAVGYEFKKYGLINTEGKILFRPQFDELSISDGSALVRIDSLYGFVDNKGNWLIKPKYSLAHPFYKGTAVVKSMGQYELINKQGQKIVDHTFDEVWGYKNNISVVEKDNKKGLINYHGKFILPLDNYSGIGEYNWYFGEFKIGDKWYVIDTAGNVPIKEGFDDVMVKGNEDSVFAIGKQNGKSVRIRLK